LLDGLDEKRRLLLRARCRNGVSTEQVLRTKSETTDNQAGASEIDRKRRSRHIVTKHVVRFSTSGAVLRSCAITRFQVAVARVRTPVASATMRHEPLVERSTCKIVESDEDAAD
jgi:hypothetical protein